MGILAAHCAFFKGASRVVLIDREADRLQFAKDRIPKLETLNFGAKKARTFPFRTYPKIRGAEACMCAPIAALRRCLLRIAHHFCPFLVRSS